jgi:hypothetical protein
MQGYNEADYDFYIEAVNGKWSQYLYQLSSTGAYIVHREIFPVLLCLSPSFLMRVSMDD